MRLIIEVHSNFTAARAKFLKDMVPYLVEVTRRDKEVSEEVYIIDVDVMGRTVTLRPMSGGQDLVVPIKDIKKVVIY